MSSKLAFSNGFIMLSGINYKRHGWGYLPCKIGPGWKRAGLWEREPEPTLRARGVRARPGRAGDLVALDRPDWEKMGAGQCGLGGLGVWAGENGARDRPGMGERVGRARVAGQRAGEVGARLGGPGQCGPGRPAMLASSRYAESYKRQFAEQEFNALKRKSQGYNAQKSTCIIAVRKQDKNVKRTIIKSVVGTLDLSTKYLLQGESFPGEKVSPPSSNIKRRETSRYGYVTNLCVSKSARRKGIAINMLTFAIESAKSNGKIFTTLN
ncbi:hypothetical protein KSS87_005743 [Heliosperma pusillum]|nr:hypothetical protein KSS87_005743 [Heliosperma pusillum]